MTPMDVDQLVREAARKVAGDPRAAALFECLRPHFLNPDHDLGSMLRACGASRSAQRRLAAILGPLRTWVTRLRMIEAARQVRATRDRDETIGQRLGYSTERGFRRAFESAHGVTPHEMRLQAQAPRPPAPEIGKAAAEAGEPTGMADRQPATAPGRRSTPRARVLRRRRRAALGLLDPPAAGELRAALRRRHPRLDRDDASANPRPDGAGGPGQPGLEVEPLPAVLTATGDYLEDVVAGAVLDRILELPDAEQRSALLAAVRFANPAPFYQLFSRCLEMSAVDPEGAVALAELGVRWVGSHREMIGERAGDWQAVAWTRLGRLQAHLGDGGGAERCLTAARAELGGGPWRPWAEVEIRRVEGLVRKLERRWDEAVRAVDRAVELTRRLPEGDLDRWQILFQRLELAAAMGDAEAGLAFAAELEELLDAWSKVAAGAVAPPAVAPPAVAPPAVAPPAVAPPAVAPPAVAPAEGRDQRLTMWRAFVSYQRGKAYAVAGDDPHAEHFLRRALNEIAADPECDDDLQLGILFTLALHELARVGSRIGRPGDAESVLRQALDRCRWLGLPLLEAAAEAELAVLCALRGGWGEARQLAHAAAAFLDDLPFHREAWQAARRLRALTGAGESSQSELHELLAKVRHDLDLVAWEIPAPQATAATQARVSREESSGEQRSTGGEGR